MKYLAALLLAISLLFLNKPAFNQTIAVLNFRNNGTSDYDYLQKGISDIFSSNLAKSRDIKVVERLQLSKIISELELNLNDLIDEQTAAEVGKISGANYVVIGTYMNFGKAIRFDVKVVETTTGIIFQGGAASARAETVESVDLVMDKLAKDLITSITFVANKLNKSFLEFEFTHNVKYVVLLNRQKIEPEAGVSIKRLELKPGTHEITIVKLLKQNRTKIIWNEFIKLRDGEKIRCRFYRGKIQKMYLSKD